MREKSQGVTLFFNPIFILFLIALFGAVLRLTFLDRIPNAIGGDELNYITTAKSVWQTGTDITGTWNPISILWFTNPPNQDQAELLYLLQIPFVGPFPFSLFTARLLVALLSIFTIPLLFLIAKKLFNEKVGLISAFFLAINPWSLYMGRTAYELPVVTFFMLFALTILLYCKSWKLLFSIPLFYAAFYSYIGTKIIFIPFAAITLWYSYAYENHKKYKNIYIGIFSACILLTVLFAGILFTSSQANRTGEILLPNATALGEQVDSIRKVTIENPITKLYENKPVLFTRVITEKLYKTFSFDYLFFSGDLFFSVGRHGLFYVIDLLFLLAGIWFMAKKHLKELVFIGALSLLSTFPQLFHTAKIDNFSAHLVLLYPLLLIIMAYGTYALLQKIKFKLKYIVFIGIYILFLLNFLQIYFFQTPLQGHFDFHLRPLSRYVALTQEKNPVTIYTNAKDNIQEKYMFYTNNVSKDIFNNVTFKNCPGEEETLLENETVIVDSFCKNSFIAPHLSLAQLKDGGETFKIYNDTLCQEVTLKTYPSHIRLSDFLIEKTPQGKFCESYVFQQ